MAEELKRLSILERLGYERIEGFSDERKVGVLISLLSLMIVTAAIAISRGVYEISVVDVYTITLAHLSPIVDVSTVNKLQNTIVWDLRIPRILLAITVGVALATSGAVFQGCFRNPLVEPYILGVSSGAAFGASLGIVYPQFFLSIQVSAFIFGSVAVALAYLLARTRDETPIVTLILAGVIIGSVFSALVSILKYISNDSALREIVFWLMGGFYYASWKDVALVSPVVIASFLVLWFFGWKLNILSMGDEEARTLGVNPEKYKFLLISIATLITSLAVSTVGIIAWVGLMMPHAARLILGPDHRFVIPAAAMLGGTYLIVCDTLARTLTSAEIPVGIITSILGAPYLFYLLRTRGRAIFG
ncbi:FecCD family ABC transporter permease [Methanothrix harundinacea]|uniref:Cobalamin import system permease protein BtuC n=1 Tax=Methanothrix harundinacea (strain 6Ac) TaxID=1110509 RepID=G7WKZ4_METH6|nr:iron ABC transporter permease [Methanothrix harundinacea]AET64177.1 ABC transporter, iron chelate uptake transporter (FeCT) family, permease protein [Methanothrix harundinacea 6Ac]